VTPIITPVTMNGDYVDGFLARQWNVCHDLKRQTSSPMLIMYNVFLWWIYVACTHWGCVW